MYGEFYRFGSNRTMSNLGTMKLVLALLGASKPCRVIFHENHNFHGKLRSVLLFIMRLLSSYSLHCRTYTAHYNTAIDLPDELTRDHEPCETRTRWPSSISIIHIHALFQFLNISIDKLLTQCPVSHRYQMVCFTQSIALQGRIVITRGRLKVRDRHF